MIFFKPLQRKLSPKKNFAMLHSARCNAHTRACTPCKSPAMPNGRCRMHGGKSKAGAQHGRYISGSYSRTTTVERSFNTSLMTHSTTLIRAIKKKIPKPPR